MRALVAPALVLAFLVARCWGEETRFDAPDGNSSQLVIESSTDLAVFTPIVEAFQKTHRAVTLVYRELTTNELNAHIAAACDDGAFAADIVISSAIDQQLKLVNDGCARRQDEALGAELPDWAEWRNELFGFTYEPAVIVYNKARFTGIDVPASRFELIDLLREGDMLDTRIGTYDIESSGVGYLFAFEDAIQASTWGRLVESFGRNRAQLFCCSSEILDRVADGRLYVGYNVIGSYAIDRAAHDDRIGVILPSDYTLVLSRAAFISRDAKASSTASEFLAFLLGPSGRVLLSNDSHLLSPIDGAERLASLVGLDVAAEQSLRPIPMTPALMVGLDQAKRRLFLQQWRVALPR